MEEHRFDAMTRSLASGQNRRQILKGILGLGGAAVASVATLGRTKAARRGYSGPAIPYNLCNCHGKTCGSNGCGGSCGPCEPPDECSVAACLDGQCSIYSSCSSNETCYFLGIDPIPRCCEYTEYQDKGCFLANPASDPLCYELDTFDYETCRYWDACNGGFGYSGYCLKWTHASTDPPEPWQWD